MQTKNKSRFNIDAKYFKRVFLSFLIFILLFIMFMMWFFDQFFEGNRQACYEQEINSYKTILTTDENHKKAIETCNMKDN
jgi:hypothetical protein